MTTGAQRLRIPNFRYAESLAAARLRALTQETHGARSDLLLDFDELHLSEPGRLVLDGKAVYEQVRGEYRPRRLRFVGVSDLEISGLYAHLNDLPLEHRARSLRGTLTWQLPGKPARWAVFNGAAEPAELALSAWRYQQEPRDGPGEPVDERRDWASAPPLPSGRLTMKKRVHDQYGGDPVEIQLDGQPQRRQLFVGGLNHQSQQRPAVDAVLNLGDEASRWTTSGTIYANDRWARKGEGQSGMAIDEIQAEAGWVVERLRAGERVLVHCSAGFNRSVTICCAALMLLEDLSAEAALARVREQHPWARPDTHHWLALRWLAEVALNR